MILNILYDRSWCFNVFAIFFVIVALLPFTPVNCQIANIQEIVVHPKVLKIGGTARLQCKVANVAQGVTVFWTKIDTQNVISANGEIKADTFDEQAHIKKYDISVSKSEQASGVTVYELTIHRLQMLDGGLYKCHLYIAGHIDPDNGRLARLTIVVPPRINLEIMKPVVTTFLNAPEVSILCKASGQPTPNITWSRFQDGFKDGSWIVYGETLEINNVAQSDGGIYRCSANNGIDPEDVKLAQYDVQLQVHYRPTTVAMQRQVGQAPNKQYKSVLDCRIEGFPSPEMRWYKVSPKNTTSTVTSNPNGMLEVAQENKGRSKDECFSYWDIEEGPLQKSPDVEVTHHPLETSLLFRLEIKNVKSSHYGYYVCLAQNVVGGSCAMVYLYETSHCQGSYCPNPLQPAHQLGAAFLSPPSLVTQLFLSFAAIKFSVIISLSPSSNR